MHIEFVFRAETSLFLDSLIYSRGFSCLIHSRLPLNVGPFWNDLSSYSQSIGFSDNRSTMSYENFSFSCIQNIASACFMCGAVSFLQIWEVGMILLQANLNRFTKQDESSSQKSLAVISIRFFPRPESAAAPF